MRATEYDIKTYNDAVKVFYFSNIDKKYPDEIPIKTLGNTISFVIVNNYIEEMIANNYYFKFNNLTHGVAKVVHRTDKSKDWLCRVIFRAIMNNLYKHLTPVNYIGPLTGKNVTDNIEYKLKRIFRLIESEAKHAE